MTFEFTRDFGLIKSIITHPKLYPHISDDNSPKPEDFEPPEWMAYLLVRDGDEILGLWAFTPVNSVCWEIHTCLLPTAWGARAVAATIGATAWMWKNTTVQRFITSVPEDNPLALRFALKGGLTRFAVNPKSYLKNGKLLDQVMLGISRPGA